MRKSEEKALGLYLTSWPEAVSFDRIIYLLKSEGKGLTDEEYDDEYQEIVIWEPFEIYDASYVIENIKSAQEGLADLDKYDAIEALVKGVYDSQALASVGFLSIDPYQTVKRIVGV